MDQDTIGRRIAAARKAANMTQSALARAAALPHETALSRYERDAQEPRADVLRRIAEALDTTIDALVPAPPAPTNPENA